MYLEVESGRQLEPAQQVVISKIECDVGIHVP